MNKNNTFMKINTIIAILLILLPLIILPIWSFFGRWPWPNIMPSGFSTRAITQILSSGTNIYGLVLNSIILSLIVAFMASMIGMMTARALILYDFKFKKLFSFLSIMPIIVPATAFSMGIHVIFIKLGWANTYFGVILVHLIYALPYTINIMLDITSLVGDGLEIQAQVLGVKPLESFFYVTFPLLMPGIISSMSMAYIISYSQYFLTLLIGGGKVETLSVVMVPFIQSGDRSLAAIYSCLFILSIFIVFLILEYLIRKSTMLKE